MREDGNLNRIYKIYNKTKYQIVFWIAIICKESK